MRATWWAKHLRARLVHSVLTGRKQILVDAMQELEGSVRGNMMSCRLLTAPTGPAAESTRHDAMLR